MKDFPIRSILPPQADELESLRIFSISELLAGNDMVQELHRHDFYFILLVCKGAGIHEIDFVDFPIEDATISIMRPGQVHRFQLKACSVGYWLSFNTDVQSLLSDGSKRLLRSVASSSFIKLAQGDFTDLSACLQGMLDEYRLRKYGFEEVIAAFFKIFLIQLSRAQQHNRDVTSKSDQYKQEKLQEFLDLLEANARTKKQVTAYAEMMNLSPFQLNSITKSLLGKTPSELIENQLLLDAKRFLLGTPAQVAEIAFLLGYEDVSYFIRFFRKRMGVTPETFRKNFR